MRWALIAVIVGGLWLAWFTGQSAGVFKEMWVATSPMRQAPPPPPPARIDAVQPDYVRVTGDHAERQVLAVTYSLDHPETIKTATLELEGKETGVLARMDVPVQASGTVRFEVDLRSRSLSLRYLELYLRITSQAGRRSVVHTLAFRAG
jgi:hypothetical protein